MRSVYELKAHKDLQEAGFLVDYKIRPRFLPRHYKVDFFGVFDLIAHREDVPFVRWISIKGLSGNRGENKKEIAALKLPPGNQKEQWHTKKTGKRKMDWEWVKVIID
jgi:hypothetical protein